ncbi:hypothetical protein JCM11641_004860 [Rhodosporidiobolus odoratus]
MHRPRRSSLSAPSPLSPAPPSPPLSRQAPPSSSAGSALRRTPSTQLLTRLSSPGGATTAVCTAPSNIALRTPIPPSAPGGPRSSLSPSDMQQGRTRRLSLSRPSQPIPISPTSPPRTLPGVTAGGAADARRRDNRETTLAYALRTNDTDLLRSSRASYAAYRSATPVGEEREGSGESGGSNESFDVPVVDTSHAGYSGAIAAAAQPLKTAGLVGGVRYINGRRKSSLANYTGLPQPPTVAPLAGEAGGRGGTFRYSLGGLTLGGAGGARGMGGMERRASIATTGMRPPSPAAGALRPVAPLTSSDRARRPSSPSGHRPSGLVGAASSFVGSGSGSGSTPGTNSLLGSSTSTAGSAMRRPPSPSGGRTLSSHAPSASVRSPSPARTGGPRIIRGFNAPSSPPSALRAPSPARHALSSTSPPGATPLSRSRSASHSGHIIPSLTAGASTFAPSSSTAAHSTTRPRSRLANRGLDQQLEIRASRDFAALDDYYEKRRERGTRDEAERRVRKEAEERLRKGYDRLDGRAEGTGR